MQGLTPRQLEVLNFLKGYIQKHAFAPTFAEIQAHFGFNSLNAVSKHLKALKAKGALHMENKRRRSVTLPMGIEQVSESEPSFKKIDLPIIGQITAGLPLVIFSRAKSVTLPAYMVQQPERTYALIVFGDNLQDEMMLDGDLILVEARQMAAAGETIVALVNKHETVVARYYPMGELIQLVDRHRNHHPMILRNEDVEIQGIVITLLRTYI